MKFSALVEVGVVSYRRANGKSHVGLKVMQRGVVVVSGLSLALYVYLRLMGLKQAPAVSGSFVSVVVCRG